MIVARAESLAIDEVLHRREMIVAVATEEITAAALLCDVLIAKPSAHIGNDSMTTGALAWRFGRRALRTLLDGDVADAYADDPMRFAEDWVKRRSTIALDSAAALIRRRGRDALERAEFARLFAIGEPQEGLAAFLEKRAPRFR